MIYHPIINRLANLDLCLIAKPSDKQKVEGEIACFCPICGRAANMPNDSGNAAQGEATPHFIIYPNDRGGLYDGTGVDNDRKAEKGAVKWMCTKSSKQGYGAIELYAAIHNLPMHGVSLQRICKELAVRSYGSAEQAQKVFPMLFGKMDYREVAKTDIDTFHFQPKTDFNPQELASLGCEVTINKGVPRYSFGEKFSPSQLNDDFRVFAIDRLTLPRVWRNGKLVSEVIYGTPWNPLFVCFATDEISMTGSCGCLFRPAMKSDPIVFSTNEDHTVRKVSRWLMGDRVFTYAVEHRDSASTAVRAAIKKYDPDESYEDMREVWVENLDKDGFGKDTYTRNEVPIPANEIKARNIVFCRTPEDAISVYYSMRSLRQERGTHEAFQKFCWYHVAFAVGRQNFWYVDRGEWKVDKLDFTTKQYLKMTRFADKVIMLYPNDITSQRDCGAIAAKYTDLCYATLPNSFHSRYCQRWPWIYGGRPHTVRDYMLTMQMDEEDNFRFDHDIRLPLYSHINGSVSTNPFDIDYPRDPRSGRPKPPTCKVSPTKVWLYMATHGYYRMVDPDSTDTIGQYIRLEQCFVRTVDSKSIIQEVKQLLNEFILGCWTANKTERELMSDCANMIDKTFNEKSAGGLPSMVIDFSEAFSAKREWFYFRNTALKITPDSIVMVPYDKIDFFIPASARKPYDFQMPKVKKLPFEIMENPEYHERLTEIERQERLRNDDGLPVYSTIEIGEKRAELEEWAQTYRWVVDWNGTKEQDLWPVLRVIRGCSNVLWQREQDAMRNKSRLTYEETAVINSHFANMISCIGRLCYRSWDDMQSICPYLLEDNIADEKQASGGSGKSVMVNLIVGTAVNVMTIDMKPFVNVTDTQFALSELMTSPGKYRVVHWEDKPKGFPLKFFYNMISTGTRIERKYFDPVQLKMKDSPLHVITSNNPLSDDDDSTVGRFPLVSFSDRFARANPQKRKPARSPKDVMKNFRNDPEQLTDVDRNQAILICAMAVQFIMKYKTFAIAPQQNVRRRQMVQKLSESIVNYFDYFFGQEQIYGVPICTDDMFLTFMRDWADASEDKSKQYSRATFKKKLYDYCDNMNITCNPKHLFENACDKDRKCFKLKTWVTQEYFVGREWENDNTIEPKYIRYLQVSQHVFFFYRPGKDHVPADYKELKAIARRYTEHPDPLPYLNTDGTRVYLTPEEKERWEHYISRKQGKRSTYKPNDNASTTLDTINDDSPF